MSRRLFVLTAVVTCLLASAFPSASAAAADDHVILAQEPVPPEGGEQAGEDEGAEQGEVQDRQDEEGQERPEAETGANEGETEEAQTETGPPWTYQMAWLGLLLLLALFGGIALLYYRFVVLRQRGIV